MSFITSAPTPVDILYIYAPADKRLGKGLDKHLSAMKRQGLIRAWHESDIPAGAERADEITRQLKTARIVLLLISPDLLASDDYYNFAIRQVLERHEAGKVRLIPIILRPVDWQGMPLQKLHCLQMASL